MTESDLTQETLGLTAELNAADVRYAVCGGLALEGQLLAVVSLDGLVQLKRLAGRPQDLLDLKKLGFSDNAERKSSD